MKRISLALILALLASLLGGCRYWVIEADSVQIGLGLAALAEEDASTRESEALRLHSRDENGSTRIRDAQERLIALGYLKDEPTGYLGPNTEAALAAFQKDSALSPTGLLDVRTATLLLEAAQKTENLEAVSPQITAIPVDLPLGPGSKGEAVEQIQKLLSRYGFYTGAASGSYDADTQKAVEAFQRYCVSEYGTEFDMPIASATAVPEWLPSEDQLLPAGSEPGATPTPAPERAIPLQDAPVALPTLRPGYDIDGSVSEDLYAYLTEGRFPLYRRTLQRGDAGDDVLRLQRRLYGLNYFFEELTGQYDATTADCLKVFQQRNNLQPTGIADEETQKLLYGEGDIVPLEAVSQPFYIKVSIDQQRVYVYRWVNGGYNYLCRTMVCSTGLPGHDTPIGVYVSPGHRDGRWHLFEGFHSWAQYAFIIKGSILFHSILFYEPDESTIRNSTVRALGTKASHGCVRLSVLDAKWIYEHCGKGQVIEVYDASLPTP